MATAFPNRAVIGQAQLASLRSLLQLLAESNQFYRAKLRGRESLFHVSSLEEFQRHFPFTTKQEIAANQEQFPPYGTNLTQPIERYSRFHQTSGTTSKPVRWLDTPEAWQWMVRTWTEVYLAAGVTATDRIHFAFSFGPFLGFWLAFDAAAALGCLCIPGGGMSSAARLRLIFENEVTVLCCTPTYAFRLAEVARAEKFDLAQSKVRLMIVAGEPGGSAASTRQRLESDWPRTRIFDHHGMTETGPASFECPSRPGRLHIIERSLIPEIVQPGGDQPVRPGQEGELILTNLGRTGSPLLRYRTGDLVRAAHAPDQACECGRFDLALDGGILGRCDDMLIVKGVNIYPAAVEAIIRQFPEIAEFQVEARTSSPPSLSVTIEPAAQTLNAQALAEKLKNELQAAFNLSIPVKLAQHGQLPRFEMKAQRWRRV